MHSAAAAFAVFLAGCALLVTATRWWRPAVSWRAGLGYVALTTAFFAQPLLTGALQVGTDLAYEWLPFSEVQGAPSGDQPRNFFQEDTLLEQLPFHALVRQRLLAGEAPLWAHELGTGEPLLGNGQSAPFAPLHALALPLAPERALTVAAAWQTLVGLLGAHALLLWLGAGLWGAVLGAVATGFSTYAVAWTYDTPGMAAAFVPGLLLGILLVQARVPRGWTGLLACALGLALSGHPETMAHAGVVGAAVVGVLLLRRAPPRDPAAASPVAGLAEAAAPGWRWRFLGRLAAAAALTAALAAPALLPMVQHIPDSVHGRALERSPENFQPPPFAARYLLPLFSPLAMGNPPDGNYSLKWSFNEICTEYAGLLTLALALAGALAWRGRPLLVLAGGAVALLIALRISPFFDLMLHLPVIGPGAHGRLREFWVMAVAVAAGSTLDRMAASRASRALAAVLIAAAAIALALAPPPAASPWPRIWWWAALLGAAATLVTLLAPRLRPRFPPVVVAALVLDLFLLGIRYYPASPPRPGLAPPPTVEWMARQQTAAAFPWRVSFEDFDLPSNLNVLYGLWDPRGDNPMRPQDAARMTAWWLGRQRAFFQKIGDTRPRVHQAGHDYLGVRYMETSHERTLEPPWHLTFEGLGGRVWENPEALPLFSMPRAVQKVEGVPDLQRAAMSNADFRQLGYVLAADDEDVAADAPASPQSGEVRTIRPCSNGFDVQVESASGGVVVSGVSYAVDWQIAGAGATAAVCEVNGGFLGFRVPPGAHAVRLRYRPRGWTQGFFLLAGGILAALLGATARRRGWRGMAWF